MINQRRNYNERLFNSNFIRTFFHLSRFNWIKYAIKKYKIKYESLIEIGCFDGKIFEFLPVNPINYKGYDANWEGGLDKASKLFLDDDSKEFIFAESPKDIILNKNETFNLGISIETFEHIPPELVCPYLDLLSKHINGYFLLTVPNEVGLFFLIKRLIKPRSEEMEKYSLRDILNITFGKTNYVERDNHKGFNYEHLIYDIKKYFNIIEISNYPTLSFIPKFLSFGVGVVALPKK